MSRKSIVFFPAILTAAAVFSALPTLPAAGADPMVYPAKGQSQQQMEMDKSSCYSWAKGQTGFDPMQAPAPTTAPPPQGGAVKGAAKGAAVGAAAGAIAGDAGKGAAIGAAAGGTGGAIKKKKGQKDQQAQAQQQAAATDQKRADYNRAWGACLEGKGYTVK
jgi:hypothetical protein